MDYLKRSDYHDLEGIVVLKLVKTYFLSEVGSFLYKYQGSDSMWIMEVHHCQEGTYICPVFNASEHKFIWQITSWSNADDLTIV